MADLVKFRVQYDADIVAGDVLVSDSDQAVANYYNAPGITPDGEIRAAREQIMEAINVVEFKALGSSTRDAIGLVMAPDSVVIRGSNARTIILNAFPGGTITRANLLILQTELESAASRTRAERGGFLGNALSISALDVVEIRV